MLFFNPVIVHKLAIIPLHSCRRLFFSYSTFFFVIVSLSSSSHHVIIQQRNQSFIDDDSKIKRQGRARTRKGASLHGHHLAIPMAFGDTVRGSGLFLLAFAFLLFIIRPNELAIGTKGAWGRVATCIDWKVLDLPTPSEGNAICHLFDLSQLDMMY